MAVAAPSSSFQHRFVGRTRLWLPLTLPTDWSSLVSRATFKEAKGEEKPPAWEKLKWKRMSFEGRERGPVAAIIAFHSISGFCHSMGKHRFGLDKRKMRQPLDRIDKSAQIGEKTRIELGKCIPNLQYVNLAWMAGNDAKKVDFVGNEWSAKNWDILIGNFWKGRIKSGKSLPYHFRSNW